MTRAPSSCRHAVYAASLLLSSLLTACSGDDPEQDRSPTAGSGGATGGTTGATGGATASGGTGGQPPSSGGATSSSGGSPNAGGSGPDPLDAGTSGTAGQGSTDAQPPPPTDAGTSIYAVDCRDHSAACQPHATCLNVGTPEARIGSACSNRCEGVDDCSAAPSGAAAQVGCVQFTAGKHCVLVCNEGDSSLSCPSGMDCYTYPGSPIGYCLWM